MKIINNIPWKALAIALVFMGIGFVIGAKSGHRITWLTTEKTLNTASVSEAINKPTTSTTNNTAVNVGKVKKSDSLKIVLDSKNRQTASTYVGLPDSCISKTQLKKMSMKEIRQLRRD
ncbi:MAG: hypothetical protein AAGH46_13460 [Bacteroidota bacterium]